MDPTKSEPNRIYRVRGPGIGECEITVSPSGDIIDRPQTLRRWRHMTELAEYARRQRWAIEWRPNVKGGA